VEDHRGHQVLLQVVDHHLAVHQVVDRLQAVVHRVHKVVHQIVHVRSDQHQIVHVRTAREADDRIAPVQRDPQFVVKVQSHREHQWDARKTQRVFVHELLNR